MTAYTNSSILLGMSEQYYWFDLFEKDGIDRLNRVCAEAVMCKEMFIQKYGVDLYKRLLFLTTDLVEKQKELESK